MMTNLSLAHCISFTVISILVTIRFFTESSIVFKSKGRGGDHPENLAKEKKRGKKVSFLNF